MVHSKPVEDVILELEANWFENIPPKVQQAIDALRLQHAENIESQDKLGWYQQLPAMIRKRAEDELGNPGHVWLERAAKFIETGIWPDKES